MKFIFCITAALASFVLNSHASSIDVTERDTYLRNIVEDMWNQLIENDLSNLPVQDYDLAYNTTTWGHELVGHAYYEDGFVIDIGSAEIDSRSTSTIITQSEVNLRSAINFYNLQILYDVRAEFTVGNKVATVIIKPTTYVYSITFTQNLTTLNVVSAITTESNSNENFDWDFNPDDPLFSRLKKHYITHALGTSIARNAISSWRPTVEEMLKNAAARIKFPELVF